MGDSEGNSDHEDKHGKRNEDNVGGSVRDEVDLDGPDAAAKGSEDQLPSKDGAATKKGVEG